MSGLAGWGTAVLALLHGAQLCAASAIGRVTPQTASEHVSSCKKGRKLLLIKKESGELGVCFTRAILMDVSWHDDDQIGTALQTNSIIQCNGLPTE